MPRHSKPFFRKQTQSWYFSTKGKQHNLGKDRDRAFQKFHELMATGVPTELSDTVTALCNLYLGWCLKNRSEGTYKKYRHYLSSFIRFIGKRLQIRELKPLHVSNWLADNPTWQATSQHDATRAVKRVFNWAKSEGRLESNPIKASEAPSPKRREHAITPEQHTLVMSLITDQNFRDYLTLLYDSGARPQEARVIEAHHCQLDADRIVLPPSDAKGEEDYRMICLTPPSCELVRRLCLLHPEGPILRNTKGIPWTKDSVNCRFSRIKTRLKKTNQTIKGLRATSWRHGFATEALKRGVDPVTVSVLMGHKDTTMVARTYQHLAADADYLSRALSKARGLSG
jgi:integrase